MYEAFLKDTLAMSALTCAETIAFHFTPAEEEKSARRLVRQLSLGARNERRFTFRPQAGETFAQRIAGSFEAEKSAGGEELVMIGSDSPTLTPGVVDTAFDFIYNRSGMAVGPSGEGGVFLIGVPSSAPMDYAKVFSEGSELENLVGQARAASMPFMLLPETVDVDVEPDLVTLVGMIRALEYERRFDARVFPTHTHKVMEELGLVVVRSPDGGTRSKRIELTRA